MKFLCNCADRLYAISPSFYYTVRYAAIRRRLPSFENPTDLSEWLLSQMLKPEFSKYAEFVDKIRVRDYITRKGLGEHLPVLYGVWEKASDIDFESLPISYALKTNHGCGGHIICHDSGTLDKKKATCQMESLLHRRFSIREPHYAHIRPMVYAEEIIPSGNPGSLPVDFKFHCINGHVNCILTCSNRNLEKHSFDLALFDTKWNVISDGLQSQYNKVLPPTPYHLKEMINIAEQLSQEFPFVRVDLYDTPSKIFFGELTFTPASSLLPYFTTSKLREMSPNSPSKV